MSPTKCTVVEYPFGGEPTCCLAHGSAGTFICAVHAMLYLMGKVVAATISAVTSCRCAERCHWWYWTYARMLHANTVALPDITTMSNFKVTTDSHIPVLTGVNYVLWKLAMKAYLQSTGHTWVMEIAKLDSIDSKSTNAQMAHYIGWTKANNSIVESVNMNLSDALCQWFEGKALAAELLKALDEEFSTVEIAVAYVLFKELLDLHIPDSSIQHLPLARRRHSLHVSKLLDMSSTTNVKPWCCWQSCRHLWTLLLRCSRKWRTLVASRKILPLLRFPRLLSCHGTSTTSPEKGSSQRRPTRSVLSSTRGSRTLHSGNSRSSHKGNSPAECWCRHWEEEIVPWQEG